MFFSPLGNHGFSITKLLFCIEIMKIEGHYNVALSLYNEAK